MSAPALCLLALAPLARAQEDVLDRLDDQLSFGAWNDAVRFRLSGTLDLEEYSLSQPATGVIYSEGSTLFVPRLSLFLDAQAGAHLYAFVQARADNGFDPGEEGQQVRLDEYALRLTPWDDGRFNLQVGKFATVVGNWAKRHDSWDNPFITAPLPYENLTGIWDTDAVRSVDQLLAWAGVLPRPDSGGAFLQQYRNIPVLWGPSYSTGAAVFGQVDKFQYSLEVKNTSLSSRPGSWSPTQTQWQDPTYSARLGYVPGPMWSFGVSASEGGYLQASALPSLPIGASLDQYREIVLGQDVAFAWHRVQVWAEAFEARFEIPGVGNADTEAYYVGGEGEADAAALRRAPLEPAGFLLPHGRLRPVRPLEPKRVARRRGTGLPLHGPHAGEGAVQHRAPGRRLGAVGQDAGAPAHGPFLGARCALGGNNPVTIGRFAGWSRWRSVEAMCIEEYCVPRWHGCRDPCMTLRAQRNVSSSALLAAALALCLPRPTARADDSIAYKFENYREEDGRITVETQSSEVNQGHRPPDPPDPHGDDRRHLGRDAHGPAGAERERRGAG